MTHVLSRFRLFLAIQVAVVVAVVVVAAARRLVVPPLRLPRLTSPRRRRRPTWASPCSTKYPVAHQLDFISRKA